MAALVAVAVLAAASADAVCDQISGDPPPVPEFLLTSKTIIRAASGGVFGDGNDKFRILKGTFAVSQSLDFVATHSLHVTLRHTDATGPVILSFSLPAGSPWVALGSGRFRHNDPPSTIGPRYKVKIFDTGGFVHYKIVGLKQSLANLPLVPGDTIHITIQIEDGGVGDCVDSTITCLTATATGAACH